MFLVETVEDLWDHLGYVILYAPNEFPYRDFLPADGQMNLDLAFQLLRDGVVIAFPEDEYRAKREILNALLDHSYSAFKIGDEDNAVKLLHEFQDNIFKR